jgi:biotin carboxyl carrier protein
MPGTILKISANVGDSVKRGQPLVVLEAMKMENDIVSPVDGRVASINVAQGDSVNAGDMLASLN